MGNCLLKLAKLLQRRLMDLGFITISALRAPKFDEYTFKTSLCSDQEDIKTHSRSILWFTYRTNFPAIGGDGPTSDKGWGCMLRCGQMLLAHALQRVHLGRSWQWQPCATDLAYRRLICMFQDKRTSLFSVQQIAQMGVNEGRAVCEWFGPNTVSQCLKKLTIYDNWSQLSVHVAMDNVLFADDVRKLAAAPWADVEIDDDDRECKEADINQRQTSKSWRPILILVPLRLGLSTINREYLSSLREFFKLPQCCGILGGRPNHAVFFTGISGEELYYLDPHTPQKCVDLDVGQCETPVQLGNESNLASPTDADVVLVKENGQACGDHDVMETAIDGQTTRSSSSSEIKIEDVTQTTSQAEGESVGSPTDSKNGESSSPTDEFDDTSYHCGDLAYMHFDSLDPSLALGFVCVCEEDFDELLVALKTQVLPASEPSIFELLNERPSYWPTYVPYTSATQSTHFDKTEYDDLASQYDSSDEFELLVP